MKTPSPLTRALALSILAVAIVSSAVAEDRLTGGNVVIGPIIGPIAVDPVPVTSSNFKSLNVQLTFAAPAATATVKPADSNTGPTAAPSASGYLNAYDWTGTPSGSLSIFTRNLPDGAYTISTTKISDGSSDTLGTLTINHEAPPPPYFIPLAAHSNVIIGGPIGSGGIIPIDPPIHIFPGPGAIIFGPFGTPLPTGYDLFDVATVTIADSTGATVLTASTSPILNGQFHATAALTVDSSVADAKGFAQLQVTAQNGKVKGILSVRASGLPASTMYTYAVDGTDVGTVTTSAKGHLSVYKTTGQKKAPLTKPFSITAVTVHDDSGTVILSGSF